MSEPKTIESALKGGEKILAFSPLDGWFTTHFEGGIWQGQPWRTYKEARKADPTHWMPLPEPPK